MPTEQDTRVAECNRIFSRYHNARSKWYNRGIENEELVYSDREGTGTQLKDVQLKKIQVSQSIPITVNILAAVKEQIQAFLTAFKPSMTCVPVGKSSKAFSYVWKEICSALWYLNTVSRELDAVIGDSLTVGNGYLRVRPSSFYVANDFNTVIEYIPWQYVFLDPNSKRQDLKDHECIILSIPYTSFKAKKIYNLTDAEVASATSHYDGAVSVPIDDFTVFDGQDDKPVWVQEFYKKEKHTVYYLEDGRQVTEKPTDEGQKVTPDGKLVSNKVVGSRNAVLIRYMLKIGNLIKQSIVLPCSEYPIIKVGCKWNKKPYDYPIVHDIIDLQKAFNSFLAITILNAQVASNAGYIAPEGSVDKAQFAKDMATPGAVAEFEADPALPNGGAPIQKVPQPLANAWYQLMTQIIHFIEYVTGIYGVVQGNGQDAPSTLGATNSLQDLGTQRIKRQARHIDYALNDLFNSVIEFSQHYSDEEVVVSYINNTDAVIQIRANVAGQLQQDGTFQESSTGPEQVTMIENIATEQVRAIIGSTKVGQYKIRFSNASDMPSTRAMALTVIRDLMAHMSSPEIAVAVAEQALELLDLPDTDMILDKVNVIKKMEGQISQLGQQVEKLSKENEQLTQEVFQKEKQLKLEEFDKGLNKTKVKLETLTDEQVDKKKDLEKQAEKKQSIYN